MSIRHWFFRLTYLSLSLLVAQISINAADIPTAGNVVVQIIQAASFCTALFFKGAIDYKPVGFDTSTGRAVYGRQKSAPFVINTSEQTKTHASTGDTSSSHETSPNNKDEAPHVYGFAPSEKEIARQEQQKKSEAQQKRSADSWAAKAQRKKEYIEKQKADNKGKDEQLIKEYKEKQAKLAQQVTTLGASAQVLITQTTPATDSNEPMVKAKEDKPQAYKRNDGAESKKDMHDNEPPHETGIELNFSDKPNQGLGAHPWRQKLGHYAVKNVENMKEVQNAVSKGIFRGVKDGKFQYDWTCPDTGKQVWVETIGNTVQNCGFNLEPWSVGENGFLVRPDLAGPPTRLLKGVTVVGTGSVVFSSEYLAQTQEDAQKEAKKTALEKRFEDIIDPYGIKKLSDSTTSNLMKADSNGRIDYNDVTRKLVSTLEPKTSEVRKIMDDVVKKSTPPSSTPSTSPYKSASPYASMKTDKASLNKAMSSKPSREYKHKFISESHKKAYMNSMKPKWTKKKD